ncbi:primase homolog protein isoform X1 [Ziziphus jujuba]|uniref:Primase homolog protein isoform X1 n=2 Tax=Ziziphus jujuba TaxID=326968 RepID=A0A6P4A9Y4_ZIZJJ|nr:primase homolog protein isoform X1 [Ziziphus jujuba]
MGSNWLIQCMSVSRPIHTALFFSFKRLNIPFTTSTLFFPTTTTTSSARFSSFPSPSASANLDNGKVGKVGLPQLDVLKQKMELLGIICTHSCVPGHYYNLLCPKCKGGQSMERSLSLHIEQNGDFAMWRCFRFDCGWAGRAFADDQATRDGVHKKVTSTGNMTEKSLGLVPLDDKAIAYFRERMISEETLHRNGVMRLLGDKLIIAFTYKQKGLLVGCKYRTVEKKFWQERGTEKVLYGLDDIVDADEIIIVEGELDKLSMEEAGFRNCVSVPAGAPTKVSNKLPSSSKDTAYQYLQNCKTYLDKVSRIILATDGDAPGQALAEELARRLGKDRCWQVRWPEKDEYSCFKDANEVLKYKGPDALKKVIESAKLYRSSIEDQVTEGI